MCIIVCRREDVITSMISNDGDGDGGYRMVIGMG